MLKKIFIFAALVGFMSFHAFSQQSDMKKIMNLANENYTHLEALYTNFHQFPELAGNEVRSSKTFSDELFSYGYKVRTNIGGYGVVGVLENGEGKTLLLRTEMDALPIKENTGLNFASKVFITNKYGETKHVMHACGHDLHMTSILGTAKAMAELKNEWSGTLIIVAQPAEEVGLGAKRMIKAGLFEKYPVPDYAIALHSSPELETGRVGIIYGHAFAGSDDIDITVYGNGGHGAYPHKSVDAVVLSAQLVISLQTLISREVPASTPAVITVGSIQGGNSYGVIPDKVQLQLSMLTYSEQTRNRLIMRIGQISNGLAAAAGLTEDKFPKIVIAENHVPSLYNNRDLTEQVSKSIAATIGKGNLSDMPALMASEDFAHFGTAPYNIPLCVFLLGTVPLQTLEASQSGKLNLPSLHSDNYYPELPGSIKTGVRALTGAAMGILRN